MGECVAPGQKRLMCNTLIDLIECYTDQNNKTIFKITPGIKSRETLEDIHRDSIAQEMMANIKLKPGKERVLKDISIISGFRLIITIMDIRSYNNTFKITAYHPPSSTELSLVLDYKELIKV